MSLEFTPQVYYFNLMSGMTEDQLGDFEAGLRAFLEKYGVMISEQRTKNRLSDGGYGYPYFKTYQLSAKINKVVENGQSEEKTFIE